MKRAGKILIVCLLLVLVAVGSSVLTMYLTALPSSLVETDPVKAKMDEIGAYLEAYFIDDYDPDTLTKAAADGAAIAMVAATGDKWSYYISAEEMADYNETFYNEYVGVGITIQMVETGAEIIELIPDGPAHKAGLAVGEIVTHVEGQSTVELGIKKTKELVRGVAGTKVQLTIFGKDGSRDVEVTRAQLISPVAEAVMLENNIGLVKLENFDHHSADQTMDCMSSLLKQGVKALIFDLRFNGGGMKDEMLEILDVLLPEGELFRSKDYTGEEEISYSDGACVEVPMAVLINEDTYSAAEFFAAAMQEYEKAVIVGAKTSGKGNFQYTFPLSDGSAVALSAGKYYTPKGVSLTDVGVTPDIPVELSEEDYVALYYGTLSHEEDEQLREAVSALLTKIS